MLPWPAWKKPRNPDWIREFFFYHGHYEFDPSSERTKFCMTGVTTEDHTILLELLGHDPYCYIKGPRSLHEAKDLINFWESRARATAHIYFGNKASWLLNRYLTKCRKWVIAVTEMKCEDLVEDRPWKRIENCYKVSFVHPALVKMLREYVLYCYGRESNPHIPQWAEKRNTEYNSWLLYEANVDYVERVIADRHFPPSSWFAISDKSTQTIILAEEQRMTYDRRAHRYDIWVNANITDITPIKDDRALYATRVLAYDIEAENEDGDHMPRAASNEVLSIAVIAYRDGQEKNAKSFAFELGSCESAVDHLFIFDNDEALLNAFRTFVMRSGCDALAGHNANGFDFPYLKERAKILELNQWDYQGPLQRPAKITATKNKGFSKHNLVIPGLLSVDTMRVEQETLGSRSLGLADLALRYLGDMSKMDVHPDELSRLQKSHEGRTKKHTYCVRDAVLVMRIEQAQKAIRASLNMSQLSVPIQTVLNRSQGAKGEGYIANVAAEAAMKTGIPKIMIVLSFMNRALRDRPQ
ncbi:MAG TPA: 3'-5' exonuclease, partial [Candidatus Hodarchaeales archaeon]|nr:3'-5' exonuclease [Candidatus Hodarchaeales archaeon]